MRYWCAFWEPKIISSIEKQLFRNREVTGKLRISRALCTDDGELVLVIPLTKNTHLVRKLYITNILGIICMPGDSRYLERKTIHLAGSCIFHWKLLHFRGVMASNNVAF